MARDFLAQRRFEGQPGQALAVWADDGTTVVALGVGPRDRVDPDALRRAGAALARQAGDATEVATTLAAAARDPDGVVAALEGIGLGAYRFNGSRRTPRPARVDRVAVVVPPWARGSTDLDRRGRAQVAVEATWRARDWVNRPPRNLTPTELARAATEAATGTGVEVDMWDAPRITAERLGACWAWPQARPSPASAAARL